MNFDKAVNIIIGIEQGKVDDPNDRGGFTNLGISTAAYPNEDIANMTLDRAKFLFKRDYWDKLRCDQLDSKLRLVVCDSAINHGVSITTKMLQTAIGVKSDGIIGNQTIGVAKKVTDEHVALFMYERTEYIKTRPSYDVHKKGWIKRMFLVSMYTVD